MPTATMVMVGLGLGAPVVEAQTLGAFRWQLQPYCNVLTVTVVQQGGQYQVDGTDDQCGAAQQASVVGRAFPNPDGSIGFGLTTVTTTNATAIHVDARLNVATLGGTWRDSAGNSGTFVFTPAAGTGGNPRPIPAGGIAPGTITAAQLAPSAVVGALGTCPTGQYLRGYQAGAAVCEPMVVAATTTVVSLPGASVGLHPSMATGADGLVVVAHGDGTNGDLRITRCLNVACTATASTAPDTAGLVGGTPRLAIGRDGLPIVAHRDNGNGDLRVTHCADVACVAATSTAVDSAGDVGSAPAIAIGADGLAIISHTDLTNRALRVTHCSNVACTAATSMTVATDLGWAPSIAIAPSGFPLVAYQNQSALRLVRCTAVDCSSSSTLTLATAFDTGGTFMAVPPDGRPIIVWQDDGVTVALLRCDTSSCDTSTSVPLPNATLGGLALDSRGLPLVVYRLSLSAVTLWRCLDAACGQTSATDVSSPASTQDLAIESGADGLPIMAYRDTAAGTLGIVKCNSGSCR